MSNESGSHVLLMDVPSAQDVADFEWIMWFNTFRNHILFALTGHVIFAKIFTLIAPKVRGRVCVYVCVVATERHSVNVREIALYSDSIQV